MRKYYYPTRYDAQRTVFRYAQKACEKGFCGVKFLFLRKIFNFSQKQKLHSDRFFFMPHSMKYHLIALISLSFSIIYAQDMGVRLTSGTLPNATLDVNGSVSFREGTALALVNGVNSDVALTAYSFFRITGPTAAFSITGFAGGADGRMLTLINASGQTLTLTHQATSTSANQINTGGSDMTITSGGIATLFYNSSLSKWVVTSATNTPAKFSGIGGGSLSDSMVVVNNGIAGRVKPVDFIETYAWGLDGSAGTTAGTNFIGTTDAVDLSFKTNSTENMRITSGGNIAIGTTTANTKLDVNGSIALREGTAITLANGANNNVALGSSSFFRITTPTAAFNISGFSSGQDGRVLYIINTTTYNMTLNNSSASSTAANRIQTATGADVVIGGGGSVTLVYNLTLTKWVVMSTAGAFISSTGIVGSSTYVVKSADQSMSSNTTLTDDTELLFNVNANETWYLETTLFLDGNGVNMKYAIDIPSGLIKVDLKQWAGTGVGNTPHELIVADNTATTNNSFAINNNTTTSAGFNGIITVGATGGSVKIRWAQNSSNGTTTTVKQYSYLKATRIQ